MEKWLAKPFLWLFTSAIPVFISACYGVYYEALEFKGRVVDKQTGQGIGNIRVSCHNDRSVDVDTDTNSNADAGPSELSNVVDSTYSIDGDGSFSLYISSPCSRLRFEDVDGEENGGNYATLDMEFSSDADEKVIAKMELL